ncbi:MAG: hypothetical protein ACM3QU_02025 [Verrucomicrobiota bacterium]
MRRAGLSGKDDRVVVRAMLKRQPLTRSTPRSLAGDPAFAPVAGFDPATCANGRTPLSGPKPADAAAERMPSTPAGVLTRTTP